MRRAPVHRLDHVVDGQRGDGRRGERLHLDAGLAVDADGGLDDHGAGRVVDWPVPRRPC